MTASLQGFSHFHSPAIKTNIDHRNNVGVWSQNRSVGVLMILELAGDNAEHLDWLSPQTYDEREFECLKGGKCVICRLRSRFVKSDLVVFPQICGE